MQKTNIDPEIDLKDEDEETSLPGTSGTGSGPETAGIDLATPGNGRPRTLRHRRSMRGTPPRRPASTA